MSQYDRVRVLLSDYLNLPRGKYLSPSMAKEGVARLCIGLYALTYDRELIPAPGGMMLEGLPDVEAVFDPETIRPSWEPGVGVVVADQRRNGEVLPLCSRTLLKRTVQQWEDMGYNTRVGIELEAFIFQRDENGEWKPYETPGSFVYGTGPTVDPDGLIDEIWSQADRCGLPIESIHSEFDWPQFELTLQHRDALTAIDDIFLFRVMAKEVLAQNGYLLSFMPKPLTDRGGSGFHVNFSFTDTKGNNVMSDPAAKDSMSELSRQCVAGLLHHHEGMAALLAPTVNSYKRLRPGCFSGYWANWARDHRGVTVRVAAEQGAGARLEHRMADCTSNPYLATATVLQAARLGVTEGYELPPEETGDCFETVNTKRCVPENLCAALEALESDQSLVDAIGQPIVDHLTYLKRVEWNKYLGHTTDWEIGHYLEFI